MNNERQASWKKSRKRSLFLRVSWIVSRDLLFSRFFCVVTKNHHHSWLLKCSGRFFASFALWSEEDQVSIFHRIRFIFIIWVVIGYIRYNSHPGLVRSELLHCEWWLWIGSRESRIGWFDWSINRPLLKAPLEVVYNIWNLIRELCYDSFPQKFFFHSQLLNHLRGEKWIKKST